MGRQKKGCGAGHRKKKKLMSRATDELSLRAEKIGCREGGKMVPGRQKIGFWRRHKMPRQKKKGGLVREKMKGTKTMIPLQRKGWAWCLSAGKGWPEQGEKKMVRAEKKIRPHTDEMVPGPIFH